MKEPKELQCLPLTLGFRWMLPVIPRNWIQPCIVYKWLMRCTLYATATNTKHHKTIWFSHTSPFLLPLISTKSTCSAHLSSTTSPIMSIPVQCQINKQSQICTVSDQSPHIYIYIVVPSSDGSLAPFYSWWLLHFVWVSSKFGCELMYCITSPAS